MSDNGNGKNPENPAIVLPETKQKPHSQVILPSTDATDILPISGVEDKLKLEEVSLKDLGVKSDADLGDDIELERSPIDGACVVSAVVDGMPVCSYCFLPFAKGVPEFEPAEIQICRPSGATQGTRVKVHGSCHIKRMKELQEQRALDPSKRIRL